MQMQVIPFQSKGAVNQCTIYKTHTLYNIGCMRVVFRARYLANFSSLSAHSVNPGQDYPTLQRQLEKKTFCRLLAIELFSSLREEGVTQKVRGGARGQYLKSFASRPQATGRRQNPPPFRLVLIFFQFSQMSLTVVRDR